MSYIYLTPLFIVLGFLGFVFYQFFIKIYIDAYRFKRMDKNLKVFVAPFTGLLGLQRKCLEKHNDTHFFIKQMIRENPDLKAYITNLGNRPFLILCDAQLIKDFLHHYKKFRKLNIFKHIEKSYTKGIFFVPDDDWASIRSLVSHTFNNEQLKKMMPQMNDSIENFAVRIRAEVDAKPEKQRMFSVVHESQLLIGQILVRTFFSEDATKKKVMGKSLSLALADFTTQVFDRSRTGSNVLATMLFGQKARNINFSKQDKQLGVLIDAIRVALFEILDERIAKYRDEDEKDFLNNYIGQMNKAEYEIKQAQVLGVPPKARRITKQQILHQLISFYFAGIDTTGHLVAFSLYAMAQHQEIKQKIKAQINEIFKFKQDVTFDNLKKMIYTGKFMNECLRMWPPATGIMARVAKQDIKIGPYQIPSGMIVGTNIIGLMHNPKYYDDPQTFNPDRWSDQKGNHADEPYAFIPFSAGGKSCIGKYLALMQTKLIMISFFKYFDIIRSETKLRLTAKFLYEPLDDRLIYLTDKGTAWQKKINVE